MDEQRAEFEAFVLQDTGVSLRSNVEAMTPGIGLAWRAWQAATQRQQERIAELEADVAHKDAYAEQLGRELFKAYAERQELEAQVQALSLDAERYHFAIDSSIEYGRLNFKAIYDAWDGDGSFTDQIDTAIAAGKGEG